MPTPNPPFDTPKYMITNMVEYPAYKKKSFYLSLY